MLICQRGMKVINYLKPFLFICTTLQVQNDTRSLRIQPRLTVSAGPLLQYKNF